MNKKQQPFFNPELSGFCSQMAMILHSGISPLEGITIMLEDSTSEQEKEILQKILDTLMETADFSLSLKETGLFPSYLVHMVQIGEETGTLDEVMSALGEHYEREDSIAKNIRNAVTYPMIMIGMMLMVILVLIINHTKFGMSMRAVSKDFETAQLMGVKINRVISMTFIIGSFLAAVGALLYFAKNTGINHIRVLYHQHDISDPAGGGGGRHRLRARRCGGCTAHRRGGESGKSLRTGRFQRCYLVCTADHHSGHQTHGPLRRENDGEGVRG